MIELYKFIPKPTTFKAIFKRHGVSVGTVANYLGLSYPYACNILNGQMRMTVDIEQKLQTLSDQLEGGAV